MDWDLRGHQLVTHLVPEGHHGPPAPAWWGRHEVPIPHYGLLLDEEGFHRFAERAPRRRACASRSSRSSASPASRASSGPCSFRDPAGNALEFKSFRDESMVFAR
ncbi:glyoxalase [Streptomyces sp. PG2]